MAKKETPLEFFLVDATDKVLGRLATRIACILMGKHKTSYSHDKVMGDGVIVINATKIRVTGKKAEQKIYFHHTLYPGGARFIPYATMMKEKPEEIIRMAVRGMLPQNNIRDKTLKRLKVYAGAEYPLRSVKPKDMD
jgi:large subunit ribosomal protein L13